MSASVAVVTGSSSGIGRATVEEFARRGWRVIGLDRQAPDGSFSADSFMRCELASRESLAEVTEAIIKRESNITTVVNCAAVQPTGPLLRAGLDEWLSTIHVNVAAAVRLAAALEPALAAGGGGTIVNVASVHAVATSADIGVYAASKSALVSVTRTLAIELADSGIRVNAVLPGAVDTKMLRDGLRRGDGIEEERLAELADRTVIGRVGKPSEIANVIYFLADPDRSSFMTGSMVLVDGGASVRLSTE